MDEMSTTNDEFPLSCLCCHIHLTGAETKIQGKKKPLKMEQVIGNNFRN